MPIQKRYAPNLKILSAEQQSSQTNAISRLAKNQNTQECQIVNYQNQPARFFARCTLAVSCFASLLCFSTALGASEDTQGLWVSTSPIDTGLQMLLVVDPSRQVLAVYHIETSSGKVSLQSTRALRYDLQIEDFNAADPKPSSIKKMLRVDLVPKPHINTIEIIPPTPAKAQPNQPSP